ncbi:MULTISPECIES: 3-methyl-2-oxobutanoate hydroxymethyltransferase [Brevibacillus]|uniref:3-methyl-2-oxobutanoate hydroxymethyltransferase n=1 Tax=Brevibacillus TaxID=55080 RepID=UPI000302309C|nr:3-methyl-2-oxobutanoate hydroxymethyltransferase [Brevibacillus laterosporus]MBA4534818.1 3-methyl-2-oxobutanoate hydroxymethyltransferase [Brevibacillus halotolerans]MCR8964534.1 3-methyl-2-oxobutanoate hydroxymethyltransferase [Brevibacillus laterosporus]MCZ0836689.1 3-methyl-2-oxobutanoate hydroxymethyltransferase [Brevibacillus halotolerans]
MSDVQEKKPITTSKLRQMKQNKEPITMLTAYDYPSAKLAEEAGIDILLVGDSLGMVVLGYESTVSVTMDDMVHHTKAVTRAAKTAFVVADMPFLTCHGSVEEAIHHAGRLIQEGNAKAVKMEGGEEILPIVKRCTKAGIPVMGHLGLTPQSVHQLGGYKVQGKDLESAKQLIMDAKALEEAGAFGIVLECVPAEVTAKVAEAVEIPVIGIGAGVQCDGQVLVFHDVLSYASNLTPKFVKSYAQIGDMIQSAISQYVIEVRSRQFPEQRHSFAASEETIQQLYGEEVRV